MATIYAQKIYDAGLNAYVRYQTAVPTTSPDPATTTPVGVGPFTASTHVIEARYDNPYQDYLGGVAVTTPLAPASGDVPEYNGTNFVSTPNTGGGSSTSLVQWNGVNTTQFDTPILFGGAASVTFSVIAHPYGTGGNVLRVGLPAGTPAYGGAFIPFTTLVPFQSMRMRWVSVNDSGVGFGVTAPDILNTGLAFSADATVGTMLTIGHTIDTTAPANDSIAVTYSDGYGGAGGSLASMSHTAAGFRIIEAEYNGSLLPIGAGDSPVLIGSMHTVGIGVTGAQDTAIGANLVYTPTNPVWETAAKNRVGIVIFAWSLLANPASMLMQSVSFEKFTRGYP